MPGEVDRLLMEQRLDTLSRHPFSHTPLAVWSRMPNTPHVQAPEEKEDIYFPSESFPTFDLQ